MSGQIREVSVLGRPAPMFATTTAGGQNFTLTACGGSWLLLLISGTLRDRPTRAAMAALAKDLTTGRPDLGALVLIGTPADLAGLADPLPTVRLLADPGGAVAQLYGAIQPGPDRGKLLCAPRWILLDPMMRIHAVLPFRDGSPELDGLRRLVAALPAANSHAGTEMTPPILILPRLFEPELCRHLIALHQAGPAEPSGFMRELDGKTRLVMDPGFKRRSDLTIEDPALIDHLKDRLVRRLVPQIAKAFQFHATRLERHLVACYSAESQGFFRPHRDNTTKGTAHRRFAATINLNAEDYDGGDLRFPEFGPRSWRAPTGGAVVFSCSLLHEALPVTRGRRYAYLPFFYDDAAADLRARNLPALDLTTVITPGQPQAGANSSN